MDINAIIAQTLTDVIRLVIAVLGGMLINYLHKHLTQQQLNKAWETATIAVKAAEAIGYANGFDGKAKFQQALTLARSTAEKYGIRLTDAQWQALIEAAVQELKVLHGELHVAQSTHK